jgi:hypothetical protein
MEEKDKEDLLKDISDGYNEMMAKLMKKWGGSVGRTELRLEVSKMICTHSIQRAIEEVASVMHPVRKLNQLIYLLEMDAKAKGLQVPKPDESPE